MDPLQIIQLAARSLRTVIINYVDAKGASSTREVQPYSFRSGKEGSMRFFAFDIGKGQIRGFRMDRVGSVQPTENPYIPLWVVEI